MSNETFDAKAHGIDITNPVAALVEARNQYVSVVESLKVLNGEKSPQKKALMEEWRESGSISEDAISIAIDTEDGATLLAVADALSELAKKYKSYADVAADEALGYVVPTDMREDRRQTAGQLRKLTESLFAMLNPLGMVPADFPTKEGKNGEILADLPKNAHKPHNS